MRIDRRLNSNPTPLRPRRQFKFPLGGFRFWLTLSAIGILGSLIVLAAQLFFFARALETLPAGLTIADVPVGGLSNSEAEQRLSQAYASPVVLDYRGNTIQLEPTQVSFQLDTNAMFSQVVLAESSGSAWPDLWAYLWSAPPPAPNPIPLQSTYDQTSLETFLADVAARYDNIGTAVQADPLTLGFIPGSSGYKLDKDSALTLINAALRSPANRAVTLPVNDFAQALPTYDTLADLLRTDIRLHQFSGTVSIYVADLDSGDSLSIAMSNLEPIDAGGGIAYSGMSTIKIPVMVTFFRLKDEAPTSDEQTLLDGVFAESANAYTDLLLGIIGQGSGLIGANTVSDTMDALGLRSTYLAGLLDTLGAITTPRRTPANSRADINLNPDLYNQTTALDMGQLLVMIYDCSQGRGKLMDTFPDKFTADECQRMIDLLKENTVGPIFVAGGSPGAVVAHKHGWDLLPLNNVADAALVFSPGGNYAVAVYVHRDEPVPFDEANRLIISLATGVFNFYNR